MSGKLPNTLTRKLLEVYMKLKDCTYGKLVITVDKYSQKVGMIIGITNNAEHGTMDQRSKISNAIPLVRWSNGREFGIHYENIELYK